MRRVLIGVLGLALLCGCGSSETPSTEAAAETAPAFYDVEGEFVMHKFEGHVMVVDHDEIPGFMAAMTMDFPLESPEEAAGLEPGDRIRFRLRVTDDAFRALDVEKVPDAP